MSSTSTGEGFSAFAGGCSFDDAEEDSFFSFDDEAFRFPAAAEVEISLVVRDRGLKLLPPVAALLTERLREAAVDRATFTELARLRVDEAYRLPPPVTGPGSFRSNWHETHSISIYMSYT